MIRSPQPLSLQLTPGLPVAYKVCLMSRATPSADPTVIDLTGYAVANVVCKSIDGDDDQPGIADAAGLTITASIANQTGSERGHVYLKATGATTSLVEFERAAFDILLTSPSGAQFVAATGTVATLNPVSTASASTDLPANGDLEQIVSIVASGPTSEEVTTAPVEVDLTETAGTVLDLYTATSDGVIPLSVTLRLTEVSAFVAVPTVTIRKNGGANYQAATALTGLNAVDEVRVFTFSGVVPALNTGDVMELVIGTAASAGDYLCEARVKVQ